MTTILHNINKLHQQNGLTMTTTLHNINKQHQQNDSP